jgi:hypothetical protein
MKTLLSSQSIDLLPVFTFYCCRWQYWGHNQVVKQVDFSDTLRMKYPSASMSLQRPDAIADRIMVVVLIVAQQPGR